MNEKLSFIVEFKDKATKGLKDIKKNVEGAKKSTSGLKKETSGLRKMFDGVKKTSKNAFDGLKNTAKGATDKIKGMFTGLGPAIAGGLAAIGIASFGKEVLQVGMDFDQAMSKVYALNANNEESWDSLRAKAKELGSTTAFSASQAAGALEELSMAGLSAEEAIGVVDDTLMLAQASGMELADAAGAMTSTMAQFGLKGKESAKMVSDQLAKAATSAKTDVAGLGEGLKYVGASAKASNIPLNDTLATLGMLNDAGIEGSKNMAGPTRLETAC